MLQDPITCIEDPLTYLLLVESRVGFPVPFDEDGEHLRSADVLEQIVDSYQHP